MGCWNAKYHEALSNTATPPAKSYDFFFKQTLVQCAMKAKARHTIRKVFSWSTSGICRVLKEGSTEDHIKPEVNMVFQLWEAKTGCSWPAPPGHKRKVCNKEECPL